MNHEDRHIDEDTQGPEQWEYEWDQTATACAIVTDTKENIKAINLKEMIIIMI